MKALETITGKLLLLTMGSFIITLASILIISDRQLNKIINSSQNAIYEEKIDIIWSELNRTEQRLQKTGLVEAYSDDFKTTLLAQLKDAYYKKEALHIYPFISDSDLNIILHPQSTPGRDLLKKESLDLDFDKKNETILTFQNQKTWYIYREFKPWNWLIFYSVPLEEKYRDVNSFRRFLILLIFIFTIMLSFFLSVFMTNFTKPIRLLTGVSQKIGEGDLTQVFNSKRNDEIGILSRTFLQMQNSIKQKIEDLKKEINEREKAEEKLNQARDYINNIIDSMPSIIIGVDKEGKVTQWNRKAEILTAVKSDQARGNKLETLIPFLSNEMDRINKAIESGQVQTGLQNERYEENRLIYEDITIFPLTTRDNQGAVIRIDDVTEKKIMEEQLAQSYKMDAIGQLAGGIAHDFNNMLAGISGAAQLLQQSPIKKDHQVKQYIDMILTASQRASELTLKLLAFGRKSHFVSSTIDIHHVIKDTVLLLERTIDKKILIKVEESATSCTILGNFSAIQNAIMNLAINSSHAMENGGTISITTKNIQLDQNYCRLSPFKIQPGFYLDLEISDKGKGIPPELLSRIFEPFFTTKEQGKGTGLGLASVYGTVQNHKGAITVNSSPGSGTVFHIFLPCTEQTALKKQDKNKNWKGEGTVLFIDDEAIIRLTAKPILESMGFQVILAEDGEEGIQKYIDKKEEISLVITDMVMPKKSGRDVFHAVHELDKTCPVLVSSGFTRDENLDQLKKEGLAGFIQKPFGRSELVQLLSSILKQKP